MQKGITLIETLIYTSIFTLFSVTLFSFSGISVDTRLRNQMMLEIHHQGSQSVYVISQAIRNAVSINEPSFANSSTVLSLETDNPETNPTLFSVMDGTLFMKEGLNNQVALTNKYVKVENFEFSNLSRLSTPGTIRIRFSLANSDTYSNPEQQYVKDFYGTGTIR